MTIKPLQWEETKGSSVLTHTAYTGSDKTRVNHFMTYRRDDGKTDLYRLCAASYRPTYGTLEAAQRAAALEWETFIRAAVDPNPKNPFTAEECPCCEVPFTLSEKELDTTNHRRQIGDPRV